MPRITATVLKNLWRLLIVPCVLVPRRKEANFVQKKRAPGKWYHPHPREVIAAIPLSLALPRKLWQELRQSWLILLVLIWIKYPCSLLILIKTTLGNSMHLKHALTLTEKMITTEDARRCHV